MSNDGKPPVDNRYKEAVANQKAGVKNGEERRYVFRGEMPNGIAVIFNSSGIDIQQATERAMEYCETNKYKYLGRVSSKRNAYDRAVEERDAQ